MWAGKAALGLAVAVGLAAWAVVPAITPWPGYPVPESAPRAPASAARILPAITPRPGSAGTGPDFPPAVAATYTASANLSIARATAANLPTATAFPTPASLAGVAVTRAQALDRLQVGSGWRTALLRVDRKEAKLMARGELEQTQGMRSYQADLTAPVWVVLARGLVELPHGYADPGWAFAVVDARSGDAFGTGAGPGQPTWWDALPDRAP
jgi:hypothetical protein